MYIMRYHCSLQQIPPPELLELPDWADVDVAIEQIRADLLGGAGYRSSVSEYVAKQVGQGHDL